MSPNEEGSEDTRTLAVEGRSVSHEGRSVIERDSDRWKGKRRRLGVVGCDRGKRTDGKCGHFRYKSFWQSQSRVKEGEGGVDGSGQVIGDAYKGRKWGKKGDRGGYGLRWTDGGRTTGSMVGRKEIQKGLSVKKFCWNLQWRNHSVVKKKVWTEFECVFYFFYLAFIYMIKENSVVQRFLGWSNYGDGTPLI